MPTMFAGGLQNNKTKIVSPLSNVGSTGWIDCSGLAAPMSVTIQGAAAGDAIEVRVSNAPTQPTADDNGVIYGAAVVADGIVKIAEPYRWIRINRSTAAGSPATINAFLAGTRTPRA